MINYTTEDTAVLEHKFKSYITTESLEIYNFNW